MLGRNLGYVNLDFTLILHSHPPVKSVNLKSKNNLFDIIAIMSKIKINNIDFQGGAICQVNSSGIVG